MRAFTDQLTVHLTRIHLRQKGLIRAVSRHPCQPSNRTINTSHVVCSKSPQLAAKSIAGSLPSHIIKAAEHQVTSISFTFNCQEKTSQVIEMCSDPFRQQRI